VPRRGMGVHLKIPPSLSLPLKGGGEGGGECFL